MSSSEEQSKHELKHCPRCQSEFECKSGSILLCQCQAIALSSLQRDYIYANFDDCLCVSCLVELRREYNNLQHRNMLQKIRR